MNVEDLRKMMEVTNSEDGIVTDDVLCWFVCVIEANNISDLTVREIANLFRNGVEPINSLEQVQDWLDERVEDMDDEVLEYVQAMVTLFYSSTVSQLKI